MTVVDDGPGHPTAARFEVRDGDTPVDSGERSEVRAEDRFDVSDGDERWYSFSLKFDKGFSNPGGWCIPMQWHGADEDGDATDGSPQLNLECGEDGNLYLKVGDKTELLVGPLDPGVWHSYVIHVKFSNDPDVAFEEVTGTVRWSYRRPPRSGPTWTTPGLPQARTVSGPRDIGHDGRLVRRCDRVDARGVAQPLAGT